MNNVRLFLYMEAMVCVVTGIKVNMKGSLSLGRDVVVSLSQYLGKNIPNARRSLNPLPIEDPITLAVREAHTCKELKFCQDNLQHFVNEYVVILAKAVTSILSNSENEFHTQRYKEQLKHTLEHTREILEDANTKVEHGSEVFYWTHVIKRINAEFQKMSHGSVNPDAADYKNSTHHAEDRDLRYKIVIATAFIERKYLIKLCSEYNFCSKSHQCTKALSKLLIHFKTMPEDRIRMFVKYVYEALFHTNFYSFLSHSTENEFQVVLSDMSYANNIPARDIMLSVQQTVEARLHMIKLNKGFVVEHDILIAHAILSDVDHMFSNRTDAFTMFLNKYYDWLASDVSIEKSVRAVIAYVSKQISSFEEDLVHKLIDEVTVFLAMTITVGDK